jgi:DNA-binding YbaB/EbfC family protein
MLDAFKAAGAFASLMRNKDALPEAMKRVQNNLEQKRIMTDGGGGAVRVTMNGRMRVLEVNVDPALYRATDQASIEMANQIVADAVNTAIARAQEVVGKEVAREAQALGLPAIPGLEKFPGF